MNGRRSMALALFALVTSLLAGACAKAAAPSGFVEDGDAGAPPPSAQQPGVFADASTPPPAPTTECAETTKQIYVVATDKSLYRFYPDKLQFERVGTLTCPTSAGTFSMAIDRFGTAWVEFTDGTLFAVDTNDASCRPTSFKPGQTGFENFGMGYAKNTDGQPGETLYVSGAGLAALDTKTFELHFLGSLNYGRTELTAMDSDLYAFSVGSGVIAKLNKATAATEVTYRTSAVDNWAAFAFAHWGGDFWVFTGTTTSKVTRYSPTTDDSTVPVEDAHILIVGAGSSTCAPTTHPK